MARLFKALDSAANILFIIMASIMVLVIFLQVICRYCFNHALPWPEELSRFMFCLSSYLAVSISMRGDNNLRITILLDALPAGPRKILNMFCSVLNIVFFLVFGWLSQSMALQIRELGQTAVSMDIAIWPIWIGICLCSLLAALQASRNLYLIATDKIGARQESCGGGDA